jgi:hypothetical protein
VPPGAIFDILSISIPPFATNLDLFIWIIHNKQDPFRIHILTDVFERWRGEMPARREPDVGLEVMEKRLFGKWVPGLDGKGPLDVLEPVTGAPEVIWNMLPKMANDDLELGETIEHVVTDHAEKVERDVVSKAEWRTD